MAVSSDKLVDIYRAAVVTLVRGSEPDLTARQFGIFLISYLSEEDQTVRGLAAQLKVSKPAITRALDRLTELGLLRRAPDPHDRRSVLVQHTAKGTAFLRKIRSILADAVAPPRSGPRPAERRSSHAMS